MRHNNEEWQMRAHHPMTLITTAVAGLIVAPLAAQQTAPSELSPASQVGAFERGCASCHDNPGDNPAPNRMEMMTLTAEQVLEVLTAGSIAGHSGERTNAQNRALAELTAGKPFRGATPRDAASMPNQCGAPPVLAMSGPQWNGWSPEPTQTRFQPAIAAGLTAAQVPQLRLKWAFAMPGAGSGGWAQPTVIDGTVFIGSDNRHVYAVDAATGCVHWSFETLSGVRSAVSIADLGGGSYGAYFGDYLGYVYGVNAETGEELWRLSSDEHPGAKVTGSLVLDAEGGRVFVPVSSWEEIPGGAFTYNCCTFRGSVLALDARTGEQLWKTYTIDEPPQPLRRSPREGEVQLFGPAGAAVWNTPTLDLTRGLLYAGTSNAYIAGLDGKALSDAVIALDIDTGRKVWTREMIETDINCGGGGNQAERRITCPGYHGNPNSDVSASPIIHKLPSGRTLMLIAQERGELTAIDPDREGQNVWVAQVGDMEARSSIFGGAYDGEFFYRGLSFQDGTGAMAAMRAATGERVWYTTLPEAPECDGSRRCSTGHTGGTTVMPGVAFAGARDGVMRAYSARDGQIVWEFPTNRTFETVNGVPGFGGSFAGPGGPTIVDGMLFTGSGYSILGGAPGNVLLAFGLD